MVLEQLLQGSDIVHSLLESLHFTYLLGLCSAGDVLSKSRKSIVDLLHAIPLSCVTARHCHGRWRHNVSDAKVDASLTLHRVRTRFR